MGEFRPEGFRARRRGLQRAAWMLQLRQVCLLALRRTARESGNSSLRLQWNQREPKGEVEVRNQRFLYLAIVTRLRQARLIKPFNHAGYNKLSAIGTLD